MEKLEIGECLKKEHFKEYLTQQYCLNCGSTSLSFVDQVTKNEWVGNTYCCNDCGAYQTENFYLDNVSFDTVFV